MEKLSVGYKVAKELAEELVVEKQRLTIFFRTSVIRALHKMYHLGKKEGKKEAVERALELNTETLTMPDGSPSKVRTGKNAHKWIEEMLEPLSTPKQDD